MQASSNNHSSDIFIHSLNVLGNGATAVKSTDKISAFLEVDLWQFHFFTSVFKKFLISKLVNSPK